MPKRIKKKSSKVVAVPGPRLSPGDLQEFCLRSKATQAAAHNLLMVQEAYQAWIIKTLAKYGLSGKFNINPSTGEMVKAEAPETEHVRV